MAGTIRKRGKSYQAIASFRDERGKLIQLSGTRHTKRDAQVLLADLLVKAGAHQPRTRRDDLNALIDVWWAQQTTRTTVSTQAGYKSILDFHIRPGLGEVKLHRLTTQVIDQFYADLAARGKTVAARSGVHRVLHAILEQGVTWAWIDRNPASRAHKVTVPHRERIIPTPEQMNTILSAADELSPWFGVFIRLAVGTGLRRGELCALKWESVEWDFNGVEGACCLTVDHSLSVGKGITQRGGTKTNTRRVVPLGLDTAQTLRAWRDALPVEATIPSAYLFSFDRYHERYVAPVTASYEWRNLRDALRDKLDFDLDALRLHDLRHTHASWLVNSGVVPITAVSQRLGHSSTKMTLDTYSHPTVQVVQPGDYVDGLLRPVMVVRGNDQEVCS